MVIRQRAIESEDKQERHDAILDAAERLLLRSRERSASVADVAEEAGLAKGTVYLYFASKEELLLALHERHIDGFFSALITLVDAAERISIDDIRTLTRRCIVEPPLFLPLASRCLGMMDQTIPVVAAAAFRQRMMHRLVRAGAGLERHFKELRPGEGVMLLRQSYALILGLWQMANTTRTACGERSPEVPSGFVWSYPEELDRALRALWEGTMHRSGMDTRSRNTAST